LHQSTFSRPHFIAQTGSLQWIQQRYSYFPLFIDSRNCMTPNLFVTAILIFAAGAVAGIFLFNLLRKNQLKVCRGSVRIGPSTVSGRGAFALKTIREGDIIERCPALEVTDHDIGGELLNYVFYGSAENKRLVAMGYGMLFNHSSDPNVAYYREDTVTGTELVIYALRNINEGEEMYYNYGDDWWNTRGETAAF
jgi:hypothetical protein